MCDPSRLRGPIRVYRRRDRGIPPGSEARVVRSLERKAIRLTRAPGRPGAFSPEISAWIEGVIAERFRSNNPVTYGEPLGVFEYHFSIVMSADTLRHRLRNIESVTSLLGIPMETERVAVDRAALAEEMDPGWESVEGSVRSPGKT
jgi:hypothetical protein